MVIFFRIAECGAKTRHNKLTFKANLCFNCGEDGDKIKNHLRGGKLRAGANYRQASLGRSLSESGFLG
jgi:hypothetical protein